MNYHRVARVLGLLLVVSLVVPFVVFSFPSLVGADQSFVVLSGSMEPTISAGDAVIVTAVPAERISEGDIITFHREGESVPTTHRVVSVVESERGPTFVTKGDANEERDPEPVPPEAVVGRVTMTIPYLGYVAHFAQTALGTVLLVGVPMGLLVLSELWNIATGGRTETDETAPDQTPAAATADAGASESGAGIAITYDDVRLTLAVLVCFALYAGWLAFQSPANGLRVTVAVAATLATLFTATIALTMRRASEPEETAVDFETPTPDPEWVENGDDKREDRSPLPEERSGGESND
ncbi:MAG: signal peptidase I [Haloplanus sp.]